MQVIERRSRLNYVIVDKRGKQLVVHINRLKKAYDPVEWQVAAKPRRIEKGVRPKRWLQQAEEEPQIISTGPTVSHGSQVENSPPWGRSPILNRQTAETAMLGPSSPEAPSNHRVDTTFAPSDTPRPRREMGVTRESPPLTRFRSCMQILQEAPEDELAE